MKHLLRFLFLFLIFSPEKISALGRDTSFILSIRTDSTINERLYRITGNLMLGIKQEKFLFYDQNDQLKKDTTGIRSWFIPGIIPDKFPALDPKIRKINVVIKNNQCRFSVLTIRDFPAFWFHLADTKKFLPDSDYIYLEDAIVNHHTTVLLRRIINIMVNENFYNSFNNAESGISTRLKGSILSGDINAFESGFDKADSYLPLSASLQNSSGNMYAPSSWLFAVKMSKAMVDGIYIHRDESAVEFEIDPVTGVGHYSWEINYSHYQFIFLAEMQNDKVKNVGEKNLFALGPAKLSDDFKNLQWEFPMIMDYAQAKIIFNSLQKQVIDDVIHGDYNRDVIWKYSDSYFSFDQKKDTAITRILHLLWTASGKTGNYGWLGCFHDNRFRVKESLAEIEYGKGGIHYDWVHPLNPELAPVPSTDAFDKICGFGIINGWYRTEKSTYENEYLINGFMPILYDSAQKKYYTPIYWHNTQVKSLLSAKDYSTLKDFIAKKTVRQKQTFHVVSDSLLTANDGTIFHPLNLFDTFHNGDIISCTYQRLHNFMHNDADSNLIYLVTVGALAEKHIVNSADLIPSPVSVPDFGALGPYVSFSPYHWAYADRNGSFIIPPRFDVAFPFSESRARVAIQKPVHNTNVFYFTFIDSTGTEISDYQYEDAHDFRNGFAAVMKNKKWLFVDKTLKEISSSFLEVRDFENGFAAVRDSAGWFFIDKNGMRINEMSFEKMSDFENGFARVAGNKKYGQQWGIINAKGIFIVPLTYDTIGPFVNNLALVKSDTLYGFINSKGKISIPLIYSGARSFNNGWCAVKQNGKWGYVDKKQKVKIPFEYDDAGYFSEGLCSVKQDGKWGFVNADDSVIVPFKYEKVGMVEHGSFCFYRTDYPRGWGLANRNNKEIISSQSSPVLTIADGRYFVWAMGSYGDIVFCDSSGNTVLRFHLVQNANIKPTQNFYSAEQHGWAFFVDVSGKEFFGLNY